MSFLFSLLGVFIIFFLLKALFLFYYSSFVALNDEIFSVALCDFLVAEIGNGLVD